METRKLEKNLIFYTPGKKGSVFTLAVDNYVNDEVINQTVEHLEFETEHHIAYVEERRAKPRPREI